jgi:ADP-ribosylglycohydrolase
MDSDKILGILTGVALGDALGIPTEFTRTEPKMSYSEYVNTISFSIKFQYASINVPAASVSDDTEMTLSLLECLVKNSMTYYENKVIKSYINFANTSKMLGRNTRKLFKGIKTTEGYHRRYAKLTEEEKQHMQSNGSLMRAAPLSLISNRFIKIDCDLTNPNPINYYCNKIFVKLLKGLLKGADKDDCREFCQNYLEVETTPDEVKKVLRDALGRKDRRDITGKQKGWCCNTLYIALYAFFHYETFEDAMKFIIKDHPYSDSDTNASVAGALFGCLLGYEALKKEDITSKNIIAIKPIIKRIKSLIKKI